MNKIVCMTILLLMVVGVSAQNVRIPEVAEMYNVSFSYDGEIFDASGWNPETRTIDEENIAISYTSPDGKLRMDVNYRRWKDFPVLEIRPVLSCIGTSETGVIDDFKSLSFQRECGKIVTVRRITGSRSVQTDFMHQDVQLLDRHGCREASMSSEEGRSASWMPYFGIDFGPEDGLEIAIGWTGTWRVEMGRGSIFHLSAGMAEGTHFKMMPGECFTMPYTVVYERSGKTREEGAVEFHRFIIEHKSPRDADGKLFDPLMPITAGGGNKSDGSMLRILDFADKSGIAFDTFWVDANWYGAPREIDERPNCGPGWWDWTGDWRVNTVKHPDGNLKKVSDAAHARGMRFLLWFEPERATSKAPILSEHPEYFHKQPGSRDETRYLLDLGNPEAREWILGELSRNIEESGVDIYRQDFNMDPLPVWRGMDAPDRKGVSEIKHINGLYALWDELHKRFPDMMFENCASGGTRMDIEMMSRAHSYCRDDAHMSKDCDELTQNITLNSTQYIPFTGGETFTVPVGDTYAFLSRLGAGVVFTPSDFDGMMLYREPSAEETAWFRKVFDAADRMRPLYFGDFYKLTDNAFDASDIYCGYQLDREDTGEGFFMVFRRKDCRDDKFWLRLRGIDPDATYIVDEFEGKTRRMKGSVLRDRILTFDEPRSYKLVFYKKIRS